MEDEFITLYTRESTEPISCHRKEYYDNDFTTYKNHYPALVDVFLFNKSGEVLLQRRGWKKSKNPGKLHTTIGGHINWGERPEFSLVHECMDELGAPVLLFEENNFDEAFKKLERNSHKVALVKQVKEFFRNYSKSEDESQKYIKDRIWLYFGRYDGEIVPPSDEVAGYEWFNLNTLESDLKIRPDDFTAGLKLYFNDFNQGMRDFTAKYSS